MGRNKKGKKGAKKKARNGNTNGRKRNNRNRKKKKNQANEGNPNNKKKKLERALKRTKAGNPKSNATVALTCLKTALQLLKFQKDNVNNFLARHVRQQRQECEKEGWEEREE